MTATLTLLSAAGGIARGTGGGGSSVVGIPIVVIVIIITAPATHATGTARWLVVLGRRWTTVPIATRRWKVARDVLNAVVSASTVNQIARSGTLAALDVRLFSYVVWLVALTWAGASDERLAGAS